MEKCKECGALINGFDECTHGGGFASNSGSNFSETFNGKAEYAPFEEFKGKSRESKKVFPYLIAPLAAVALDYVVPIWSTWYVSLALVVISFVVLNTFFNVVNSEAKVSFKRFIINVARSINAPGTIALRSNSGKAAMNIALWFGVVTASVLIVFSNVTTANANFLESKLKAEGLELTGQEFEISCPTGFTSGLPGSEIACSAEIIFGLSVPVTVQINGPFEPYTWKAGW
jgi:hypothetical protein